jgi:O-antigen/teichoic acid export membrane protein
MLFFVQVQLIQRLFQGWLLWKPFAISSFVAYALNLILGVWLIVSYSTLGAIISVLSSQIIIFLVAFYFLKNSPLRSIVSGLKGNLIHRPTIKRMIDLSKPTAIKALLIYLGPLVIQREIIYQLGIDSNGIYQVILELSSGFMGLFDYGFQSFGLPKISSLRSDHGEIVKTQNQIIRLGVLLISPVILLMYIFRDYWIVLLYDVTFLAAGSIILWRLIGDYFRLIRQAFDIVLLPLEKFRFLNIKNILFFGVLILSIKLWIPRLGLVAVPLAYLFTNVIIGTIEYVYVRNAIGFRFERGNKLLLLKSVLIIAIGIVANQFAASLIAQIMVALSATALMLIFLPTKVEYQKLLELVRNRFASFRGEGDL